MEIGNVEEKSLQMHHPLPCTPPPIAPLARLGQSCPGGPHSLKRRGAQECRVEGQTRRLGADSETPAAIQAGDRAGRREWTGQMFRKEDLQASTWLGQDCQRRERKWNSVPALVELAMSLGRHTRQRVT